MLAHFFVSRAMSPLNLKFFYSFLIRVNRMRWAERRRQRRTTAQQESQRSKRHRAVFSIT